MKLWLILFITITPLLATAQKNLENKTFINGSTAYWNKTSDLDTSKSINDITLRADNTFQVYSRPSYSCWSWQSYEGNYTIHKDTLTMFSNYEVKEASYTISYSNTEKREAYRIHFNLDNNTSLNTETVFIAYNYDEYSHIKTTKDTLYTNTNGVLEIPFKRVKHRKKLTSIQIKLQRNIDYVVHIKNDNSLDIKPFEIPNTIQVALKTNPKIDTVYRTVKAILNDTFLRVISINKTVSKYPEADYGNGIYFHDLHYESIYTLNTNL
ncbi:hypothetical protein [Neptunitalea lumnitzerae]|uniref:Uncharacterized protein n=1 Tax=Neptunitalea lumnitzerae TaxID=2965509 RepID=A0ABQ5MFS6_9FLAO|nr:hypothetical protein [Neptunitalea sp. Y10]GLB47885.1 hypothetical protein Y10_02530 [Neptunitalea sp. Y10]